MIFNKLIFIILRGLRILFYPIPKLFSKKGLLILLSSFNTLWSQEDYRNSVQGSIGFIATLSASYERVLLPPVSGQALSIARVGYSGGGLMGLMHSFYGQLGIVTNRSKNRFELTLGGGVKTEEGGPATGIFC